MKSAKVAGALLMACQLLYSCLQWGTHRSPHNSTLPTILPCAFVCKTSEHFNLSHIWRIFSYSNQTLSVRPPNNGPLATLTKTGVEF